MFRRPLPEYQFLRIVVAVCALHHSQTGTVKASEVFDSVVGRWRTGPSTTWWAR